MNSAHPQLILINSSTTDGASHTTAAATPVSGAVYEAWVVNLIAAGTPNVPTCAGTNGFNVTWTQVETVVQDQLRLTIFRGVAGSAVAGTLTFDYAGQTNSAAVWGLNRWFNTAATLNVQSRTGTVDAGTAITWASALAAFGSGFNPTYVVAAAAGAFVTVRGDNAQGTMAMLSSASASNGETGAAPFYSAGEVSSPAIGCSGGGSDMVAIALEIAHDGTGLGGGGGHTLNRVRLGR